MTLHPAAIIPNTSPHAICTSPLVECRISLRRIAEEFASDRSRNLQTPPCLFEHFRCWAFLEWRNMRLWFIAHPLLRRDARLSPLAVPLLCALDIGCPLFVVFYSDAGFYPLSCLPHRGRDLAALHPPPKIQAKMPYLSLRPSFTGHFSTLPPPPASTDSQRPGRTGQPCPGHREQRPPAQAPLPVRRKIRQPCAPLGDRRFRGCPSGA